MKWMDHATTLSNASGERPIALDAMVMLIMGERYGLDRQDAVALASLVVDLHITQLVNAGIRGVHALLPYGALTHISAPPSP